MSKYLLDTHTWLWALEDASQLSVKVRRILQDKQNEFYFSVASVWEIAIKMSTGKLKLNLTEDLDVFITRTNLGSGIRTLPIAVTEACAVQTLPLHHRDPFDRLVVAQAESHALTILSSDANLKAYGVKVVW